MELWIKSQDKKSLRKVYEIWFENSTINTNKYVLCGHKYNDHCQILGTYATKERCLEILDEIQELINCLNGEVKEIYNSVYEMPEE